MTSTKIYVRIVLGLILVSPLALTAQSAFTLEQVMSSPFPTGLVAASQADRVAWVFDAKGVRNIWVADGPNFAETARQLTHYQADDGQPISSLRLTPDGKTAVYARGSELNSAGESANPESWVEAPRQQVFAVSVDDKDASPHLLGHMGCPEEDCEDIQISPDGHQAIWAGKKDLYLANLDSVQKARQLVAERGRASDPQWSPDGHHIAYVTDRGDHSLIAIYTFGADTIHYLSPSFDHDSTPRWLPDSQHLVFVRTAGDEARLPLIPVRPEPWSIRIADATTGDAQVLWRSGEKLTDSLPELTEDESLKVAAADNTEATIIFASEQDGHNHLYSIPAKGGTPKLLTPGNFDVKDVTLSADKRTILYSSNQSDIDRRHIWRVPVNGETPPQPLTHGETIEWTPVETPGSKSDGKSILCLGSTATSPAMPYEITAHDREMIAQQALPADFPSASLVTPKQVIFKSSDGLTLHGQLFLPRNAHGKLPGLVFMHGGPMRQMMLGFHPMGYYHNAYAENQYLASLGYAVLSVNYRMGIMYGRAFRQAPNTGRRGAAEYKDILAAGRYLQSLPQIDPQKIGLWGGSYGGFLTAIGLARNSDLFKAGVDFHGVHHWHITLGPRPDQVTLPPDLDAATKLAWQSSPDAYINTWRSPVLLIQGDDDRNVSFSQSVDLVQRLRTQHVPFEQLVFPDEIHGFLKWSSWMRSYAATADFFNRTLKQNEKIATGN